MNHAPRSTARQRRRPCIPVVIPATQRATRDVASKEPSLHQCFQTGGCGGVSGGTHRLDESLFNHGLRLQHAGGFIHGVVLPLPRAPVGAREPLPGAVSSRRSWQRAHRCSCCAFHIPAGYCSKYQEPARRCVMYHSGRRAGGYGGGRDGMYRWERSWHTPTTFARVWIDYTRLYAAVHV